MQGLGFREPNLHRAGRLTRECCQVDTIPDSEQCL